MNVAHPPLVVPAPPGTAADAKAFTAPDLIAWLDQATADDRDALPYGVISMALDATVTHYNAAESRLAGLRPDKVVGHNMFTTVAPCTNNYMVAHRFASEQQLDVIIDYVFTFRIAPLNVQLRLMKSPDCRQMYMAVQKRP